MTGKSKIVLLKYTIPALAILVIIIQLSLVKIKNLNRWKGGGYGMYSEMHYNFNQIHIPKMSVDSLIEEHTTLKDPFGKLMLMPNKENLKKAAESVLKNTKRDSIQIQIWKPLVDSKTNSYSRILVDEVYLKNEKL